MTTVVNLMNLFLSRSPGTPPGRPGMSEVAKVVFLADKLDPRKVERFPYLKRVAAESKVSLDLAILEYLNQTIEYFMRNGNLIHPASIDLRNQLLISTRA